MKLILAVLLLATCCCTYAQQAPLPAYEPTRAEEMARYKEGLLLDSILYRGTVYKYTVHANWLAGGNSCWYRNILPDSSQEYIYVDARQALRRLAFDHSRLAAALATASGKPVNAATLNISRLWFSADGNTIQLQKDKDSSCWQCLLTSYRCEKIAGLPADTTHYPGLYNAPERWECYFTDSVSPSKQQVAFLQNDNVMLRPAQGGAPVALTTNGTVDSSYGALAWSPDSKYIIGYRIHLVTDSPVYYVLSSVPNTTRGQLRSHEYKQPGEAFTTYEMFVFNAATKTTTKVNTGILDFFDAPVLHWRTHDPRVFYYEKVDRGHQRFRIIQVNAETGQTATIVDEKTNTFIYTNRIFTYYLPATDEILLSSEKDGWQHIYLVDALTGKEKTTITKGNYVVRSVDSIDAKKRELWFTASGMNPGEDPYHIHYYRIGFDGKHLVDLTPVWANHRVVFSPDKRYYTDVYSKVDMPPVSELHRTADGKKILELERADISRWQATGVRAPEVFTAKGRDGVTDIWGIICRPNHYDSTKRYPIIEDIYAGPQDAFVPKNFLPYSEMQSIAQLGFIVVQIDGMGTANRSKAFHDVCWKNLADAGLPDRIAWMKALAAKYPYCDTSRVGVFGTSAGGQNSMGALLFHPEFYKAAVSSCGCHDNRIDKQWWNEQWMGYPVGPHYAEQSNITNAAKLQGSLLLIVGEADTNVPPESTYRLADALIKAGKTFDFLSIPGSDHTDGGRYGRMKKKDFFVQHLLHVTPPDRNRNELSSVVP
jgi:dipeptidyl aminopeptidase/acylaminoacyl peptidase